MAGSRPRHRTTTSSLISDLLVLYRSEICSERCNNESVRRFSLACRIARDLPHEGRAAPWPRSRHRARNVVDVASIDGKPPTNPDRRKGTISALHMAPPIPVPHRLRYIEGITTVTPSGRGEWSRTGTGRETRYTFSPKLMVVEPLTLFLKSMVVRGERGIAAPARTPALSRTG